MTDEVDEMSAASQIAILQAEIDRLREAIRRLADQDATLSVQGGNVIVSADATLTDAEREALTAAITRLCLEIDAGDLAALVGLLVRTRTPAISGGPTHTRNSTKND